MFQKFSVFEKLYTLIQDHRIRVNNRENEKLKIWIEKASRSEAFEIVRFTNVLNDDFEEVYNAFIYS